ncbi:MAG TPA: NIPSNAP family protein [Roseiflexaceae bacterium]|nr:NIPSNAP family protein [Roseiflexaceae bacterium]
MIQQLRIYEMYEHNQDALVARFRDHTVRIMARYGFRIINIWTTRTDSGPELVYLLEWPDEETLKRAWAGFRADQEWAEIKRRTTAEHGDMVGRIEDRVLHTIA